MSEESPAFQWYAADYLADGKVQLATSVQEGIYIRLLSYCWRELSIPSDPRIARQFCKPDASIEDVEFVLKTFFIPSKVDGQLIHKRLEEERKKQRKNRRQRAEAGRKSGESRKLKAQQAMNGSSNGRSDFVATETNSSISTSSSVSISDEDKDEGGDAAPAKPKKSKAEKPVDNSPIVMEFPVQGQPFKWSLTEQKIAEWEGLFPQVEVLDQCRRALAWLKANHLKTAKGMERFLVNWFNGAISRGHVRNGNRTQANGAAADPRGNFAAREQFLARGGEE